MTIRFFKSKVFTAIFLCLLTHFSISKASAATTTTSEYDVSDGASEWIADHGLGHRGDCRQVEGTTIGIRFQRPPSNSNQFYRDKIIHELREGERVILLEKNSLSNRWILVSHDDTDGDIVGFVPTGNLIECLNNAGNINPTTEQRCSVTQTTNLFESPSLNSRIITTIGVGATITISTTDSSESRLRVIYPEAGWIFLENNVDCEDPIGSGSFVSSSRYYCLSNNINWQGNFLTVYSYNWSQIYDLPMNQRVLKTGSISQFNSYEWVEIEITDGVERRFGWVANRPLYGQYSNIENLQLC